MGEKQITVYTGDECSESKQIINLLEELEVEYTEKNVSKNRDYLTELQSRNVYSTPVIFIGDRVVLGYQRQKIQQLIEIA